LTLAFNVLSYFQEPDLFLSALSILKETGPAVFCGLSHVASSTLRSFVFSYRLFMIATEFLLVK